jgi:hypothetical protein
MTKIQDGAAAISNFEKKFAIPSQVWFGLV